MTYLNKYKDVMAELDPKAPDTTPTEQSPKLMTLNQLLQKYMQGQSPAEVVQEEAAVSDDIVYVQPKMPHGIKTFNPNNVISNKPLKEEK